MELAVAALQTITAAVAKVVEDEVKYARSFRSQFRIMEEKLELTRALLVDKGSVENKTETLKTALTHLREVIYEADDVLVDCLIRDEYLNNVSCSGCLLRYNPFFFSQTARRLKEINDLIKDKIKAFRDHGLTAGSIKNKDDEGSSQYRITNSQNSNPNFVVGLEEDLEKIRGWICDTSKKLHSIAIVGMGGLGKTTIARKIIHDEVVLSQFKQVVWITVSQNFKEAEILRRLLEKLKGSDASQIDDSSLVGELQKQIKGNTCLIVMDDIWEMKNVTWWTELGSMLRKTSERSCIIITTRNQALPSNMGVEKSRIHEPKPLDENNSWSLFSEFAFFWSEGVCPDTNFQNLGREIVKKCGGLPLAIKVIGSLLQSKSNNLPAWKNVLETLFPDPSSTEENEVMASLRLSYNDLPGHLKQCFLCFSIYPEDFEIHVEQLIRWWIAEGLVQENGSKTAKESGYQYVSELISRSLVEVAEHRHYDGRVYSCKLHDLVRELIKKIAEEEGFCSSDGNGKYWFGLTDEHDKESLLKTSKLRALFVLTPRCQVDFDRKLKSFLSLRVLDFSGTSNLNEKQVKNILDCIGSLKRLAYLNLSKAECLLEIPSSICKLFNLQFLVLRGCTKLDKIHPSITNLKKLIVLDLANCRLRYFPQGLGCLSNLQELLGFQVFIGPADNKGHGLGELRHLTHLRVLSIVISTTGNDPKLSKHEFNILSDTLSALKSLEVLAINADKCREEHIFETLERSLIPPRSLRELYLRKYYFATMPSWYGPEQLSSLQYLCIEDANIESLIPQVKNRTHESNWNVNLCLKSLIHLKARWGELQNIMQVQSLEVSKCSEENLKNFPCSVDEAGYWTRK